MVCMWMVGNPSLHHCVSDGGGGLHDSVVGGATGCSYAEVDCRNPYVETAALDAAATTQATGLPEPYSA